MILDAKYSFIHISITTHDSSFMETKDNCVGQYKSFEKKIFFKNLSLSMKYMLIYKYIWYKRLILSHTIAPSFHERAIMSCYTDMNKTILGI